MTIFEYFKETGLKLVKVRETYDKRNGAWYYSSICKDKQGKLQTIEIDGAYLHTREKVLK